MPHHSVVALFFFFNDTATTEIYTLSLHDALPISRATSSAAIGEVLPSPKGSLIWFDSLTESAVKIRKKPSRNTVGRRSEEHTSELQSRQYLVCRLLLEKKKNERRR